MMFQVSLDIIRARLVWLTIVLVLSSLFVGAVLFRFAVAAISDPQLEISHATLAMAAQSFPQSASIHTRLAARLIEADKIRSERYEEIVQQAVVHSSRAIQLAPSKYEAWVLAAAAHELASDTAQAEKKLLTALTLAPHRTALHWRLANLLLREEKLEASLPEFRIVAEADSSMLLPILRLLWQVTNEDISRIATVVNEEPKSQLTWAKFLAERSQAVAAIEIFSRLDSQTLLGLPESGQLLDNLIAAKEFVQADRVWQHLYGQRGAKLLIWNGSFETATRKGLNQFDWQFSESRYAHVGLVNEQSRTGSQALALAYLGIETTRLDTEVKQLIIVRPGQHYRLACYAKTELLETSDGPRVAVTKLDTPTIIAKTSVVASGSHDWQLLTADFVAPAGATALVVTIKQTPRFSYSAPTKGMVWFDDLTLEER